MRRFKNLNRKISIGLLLILVCTTLSPYYTGLDMATSEVMEERSGGTAKAMATSSDSFTVLEIVPHKSLATFGYLIGGQEPIDMNKMIGSDENTATNFYNSIGKYLYTMETEYSYQDKVGTDNFVTFGGAGDINAVDTFDSGYFKKVTDGEGDFILDDEDNFVVEEAGNFVWVKASNTEKVKLHQVDQDVVWEETIELPRFTCKRDILTNQEHFRKVSLDNYPGKIEVITVTPKELNNNLALLDGADLLYLGNNESTRTDVQTLWNRYGRADGESEFTGTIKFDKNNDFTWDATLQIFKRIIGVEGNSLPYFMDAHAVSNIGTTAKTNLHKLYFMLKKMNPLVFYNLYMNDNTSNSNTLKVDTKIGLTGTNAGKYNTTGNTWVANWDINWFKHDSSLYTLYGIVNNTSVTAGTANLSVIGNVFTYNGDNSLIRKFMNLDIVVQDSNEEGYTKEFFDYINSKKNKFQTENKGTTTSTAYALKYIIDYGGASVNDKSLITILDLEPSNYFVKSVMDFRLMMPTFTGSIKIVQQTTATFIGKIEDLNKEYDLIYMGLNVSDKLFTLQSPGVPKYNDTKLNGKIYLHVGDKVMGSSNNKILSYPVDWLKNVNSTECRLPGNDITKLKLEDLREFIEAGYPVVAEKDLYNGNMTKVDKTSNIYKFVKNPTDKKSTNEINNFLNEATLNTTSTTMLDQYLAEVKPKITLLESPKLYVGEEAKVLSNDNSLYINGANSTNRNLNFKFVISDNTEGTDISYNLEFYVDKNADGKFANTIEEKIETRSGYKVGTNTFSRSLDESYFGSIPWKLAIFKSGEPAIRTEVTGISAIRKYANKENIRILQINSNGVGSGGDNSTVNLQNDIASRGKFWKYTKDLNDYDITFTTITINAFENKYKNNKFVMSKAAATDQLAKDYDMLVFGFSDMYPNISNDNGAITNIEYFNNLGKSILFTHDVTSFNNKQYWESEKQFGANFNRMFRGYLSMDRFGARIATGEDVSGQKTARDTATSPYGNNYTAIHGYTTWALRRIGNTGGNNPVPVYPGVGYNDENLNTTKVSKLNSGQLTQYPYLIDETFICAPTHPQYFQLDLEDDNVVVWYSLANDGTKDGQYYDISPNDASNNYYIYNKGNISYTGVGHSPISGDMEVKLFVNTMIAAYKAGYKEPTVIVTNDDVISTTNGYYFYVDQDYDGGEFKDSEIKEIKFQAFETSLGSYIMACKVVLPDGTVGEIYEEDGSKVTSTRRNSKNEIVAQIEQGTTYVIKYKLSEMNNKSSQTIDIEVENIKGLGGNSEVTLLRRSLFDLD